MGAQRAFTRISLPSSIQDPKMAKKTHRRARRRVQTVNRNLKTIWGTYMCTSPQRAMPAAQAMLTALQVAVLPMDQLDRKCMPCPYGTTPVGGSLLPHNYEPAQMSPRDTLLSWWVPLLLHACVCITKPSFSQCNFKQVHFIYHFENAFLCGITRVTCSWILSSRSFLHDQIYLKESHRAVATLLKYI